MAFDLIVNLELGSTNGKFVIVTWAYNQDFAHSIMVKFEIWHFYAHLLENFVEKLRYHVYFTYLNSNACLVRTNETEKNN